MLPIKRASHCSDVIKAPTGVLAILLLVGIRSQGQTAGDAVGLGDTKRLWEVTIEEPASAVEYKASAVSAQDESIWLVIGRRPAGAMSGPQALALHGLDHNGKTLSDRSLDFLSGETSSQKPGEEFIDIAATGDGDLALVSTLGQVVTMKAMSGRVLRRKDVGPGRRFLYVKRALSFSDGSLLLVGFGDSGATAIKLNKNLDVVWEKTVDRDQVGTLVDGVVLGDDSFFLAGNVRHGGTASSSLWVGRFGAGGELRKSLSIPGQLVSVAAAAGGGCAVVQGINGPRGQEVWFRNYDRDLRELWNVRVGDGIGPNWRPVFVVRVPWIPDEYFVAGVNRDSFLLSRIKAGSGIVWTRTFQEQSNSMPEAAWNVGLLTTSHSVVIPFTAMPMKPKMNKQLQAVGYEMLEVAKVMSVAFSD
jgi:hypothetical protein